MQWVHNGTLVVVSCVIEINNPILGRADMRNTYNNNNNIKKRMKGRGPHKLLSPQTIIVEAKQMLRQELQMCTLLRTHLFISTR